MKHIVIIDDEISLQKTLKTTLESNGYRVSTYCSADEALKSIHTADPDLIILDIMMPGLDGITFCSLFRKDDDTTPVIFLSSRSDELSKLEALERGGDDYMTKPYSIKELLVRVSVCLRRAENFRELTHQHRSAGFYINADSYQVLFDDKPINFSVTEFRIFKTLFQNPDKVFTRDELMTKAYPEDPYISDRNVDTHITRIRKKIQKINKNFKGIESVYGLGYKYKQ